MLILVRHGESVHNVEERFTGIVDSDLTIKGIMQSINIGNKLKNIRFDNIFCSELSRAIKTSKIISFLSNYEIRPISVSVLNERDYGILKGEKRSDMIKKYGYDQVYKWRRGFDESPPDGESLQDVYNRIKFFYDTIVKPCLKKKENILVVTHGNVIRAFLVLFNIHSKDTITDIVITNCYAYFIS